MRAVSFVAVIAAFFIASTVGSAVPGGFSNLEARQGCPCSGGCNPGVCCALRCGCGDPSDTTCIPSA
ncbi:hypothetical protein VKT23_018102 [Stygiomarasmius scandens]|uniref:Uncharacterized protein n=1 Tax=Marasmiellus scandens TaxID=2682957 RepID=A0ABR1IS35_9AGAR